MQQQMDLQCCSAPQGSAHVRAHCCVCVSMFHCVCLCITTPGLTSGFYHNRRLWVIMAGPGVTSNAVMDYGWCECSCVCLCVSVWIRSPLLPLDLPQFRIYLLSPSIYLSFPPSQQRLSAKVIITVREATTLLKSRISWTHMAHIGICVECV